ncbi:MAG: T9SS type A sorting domain-containing protein [Flavobacterium sp.]|nr:T9SS type A sorting domain-containing protein [Flavobacterium sp.]
MTAFNSGGSTTFGVVITVNDIAPSTLSYISPNVFTRGTTISNLDPSVSGGIVTSYSISPTLPTGLSFSTSTGRISGTPTAISSTATYTVTAFNSGGSASFDIEITINDVAPTALSYTTPNVFTLGNTIADLTPVVSGTVLSYSISPSLPNGLSFDTSTGIISGTPTAISSTATYTVTAFNSGGSASFDVEITVNDVAPTALSYTTPNVFTLGSTIVDLTPIVSGTVLSYSVSPSLPNGLSFDTSTGVISGTPTAISSTATYTVTAFNSGGSASFDIEITINDVAPTALSYTTPNVFTLGNTIADLTPVVSGTVLSYSISPSLPNGLSFDTSTGIISGTPTAISSTATYTVTAFNSGGSASFDVEITVNDVAPTALSYTTPNVFTLGNTIADLTPVVSGTVLSYSISPSLPNGLSFDTSTGIISGTPTTISSTATYIVTAFNSGGSVSFDVEITVNDVAPNALSYTSPNVFTLGNTIADLTPVVSGTILSFSVSPSLPNGLSFDTSTGIISGTPTAIAATATYTVTAFNSGGSTTFGVVITVNDVAPTALSYTTPNVFTLGSTIVDLTPIVSGTVSSYSISPSLPNGLSFDTSTGIISGTPTSISSTATYTVTAFNSGGSASFDIEITINDVAPTALSYTTPNVFTLGNTIADLTPVVSGTVLSYSISPSLPNGLSFDTSTGIISGTPTAISSTATYTVTAFNSGGSASFDVEITVNDVAPSALSYTTPNVFTLGNTIADLTPIVSGTVLNYSVSPSLPNGLSFDTSTGIISGTPTAISSTATYTVTAFNSGGSVSFDLEITVETLLNNSEIKLDTIFVYPNPFIDSLHVTGAPANISYTVFSVDGKLIQEGLLSSNTINITHVPSGVYFLRLFGKGNQERTFKIIKR